MSSFTLPRFEAKDNKTQNSAYSAVLIIAAVHAGVIALYAPALASASPGGIGRSVGKLPSRPSH